MHLLVVKESHDIFVDKCKKLVMQLHDPFSVTDIQQAPSGVVYAKPHITKLRLNYSFGSPRNEILNQVIRNHLISTS